MKKFTQTRGIQEIEEQLTQYGFEPDYIAFENGSDWRYFESGTIWGMEIDTICLDIFGRFIVMKNQRTIATHLSEELDGELWYNTLLNILYE